MKYIIYCIIEGEINMFLNVGSVIKDDNENIYFLDSIIGQGGFGCVFKAHRKKDGAIFAVKTTLPSFDNIESSLSFQNEICLATKVIHENVIKYEFVHDGSLFPEYPPYIIMEYADGGTLGALIKRRKDSSELFNNNELTNIYIQLVNGMRSINNILVHRDVKPDNILICGDTLKITDFGLSKVAAECTRTLTFKGGGTPLYMSPEAWDYSKNTIQMDIYSMGIVFYELATLKYPYESIPRTYEECKDMHLYSTIVNLSVNNHNLSPSLVSLINRMLEKSSKRRFSSWEEILSILHSQSDQEARIDKLVSLVIKQKNDDDIERQKREADMEKQKKENCDFVKLVHSQYMQTIINPIADFADKVNIKYAGNEKLTYPKNQYFVETRPYFSWKLNIPPHNSIIINFEAILKENFTREISYNGLYGGNVKRIENYIPQYEKKDILGWGEIRNALGHGYNILLVENGDIYGDWLLMKNHNNISNLNMVAYRQEPFAFALSELVDEIDKVQLTHLYSAEFLELTDECLLNVIQILLND